MNEGRAWSQQDVAALRRVLADLFPREPDQRRFVAELGLNAATILFDAKAANAWFDILSRARQAGLTVEAVIRCALDTDEGRGNRDLQQLLEDDEQLAPSAPKLKESSARGPRLPNHGLEKTRASESKTRHQSSAVRDDEREGSQSILVDFAILTAIDVERRAVCAAFGLSDNHRVKKGARVYWRGRFPLHDGQFYELVVAQSPDMASVDAALLTSDMLRDWSPGAALMVGIAASTKPSEVRLGDVVVGGEVYYYERGKLTPKGTKPEPKILPVDATLWSNVTALPTWLAKLPISRPDRTRDHPQLHFGVIASGEKVIADETARDDIAAGNRKILAIEMEGYGFSKAVWQSFDRVRHLVIRGICDDGSPAKDDKWHQYAAASASDLARHFLMDRPLEPRNLAPS